MKKFMLLHYGFEKPTPEIMSAWNKWFEAVSDKAIEHGGFCNTREITQSGIKDLPLGLESITGYSIINAENMEEAEKIAEGNPFISSIRICEITSQT